MKRDWARRIRYTMGVMAILPFIGVTYEQAARYRDARRYTARGQMVDIGGSRLHIQCTGQGRPV